MSDDASGVIAVCGVAVIIFMAGFFIGDTAAKSVEHERAVEAGVGRWITNSKTGDTRFVYGGLR